MEEPTQQPTAARRPRAFLDRLIDNPYAATDALLAALARCRLTPEEALLQVLAPAAAEVGERWARQECDVATAHLAVTAIGDAVSTIAHVHTAREPSGERLVVVPADGDAHALASRLFGTALGLRGWDVRVLAPALPPRDLTEWLARTRPKAMLLTCTMPSNLPGAARSVAAAHEGGVTVIAGGAAFGTSPRRAAMVGADAWASSLDGVERILAAARPPRRAADAGHGAAVARDDDVLLSNAWGATLRLEQEPDRAAWLQQWVPLVLRSIRAALLTDDDDVLVHDLCWLADATAPRFGDPGLVPSMVAPLRRVVPAGDVAVHRLVAVAEERLDAALRRRAAPQGAVPVATPLRYRTHPSAGRGREACYDDVAFVAGVMCGAATGLVVLVDGDRMVVKGAHGTVATDYDDGGAWTSDAFAADAREPEDPLARHPLVLRHGTAFLGQVPIHDADGHPVGAVVVADPGPKDATWPQRQALRSLARQVELRLRTASVESPPLVILDGEAIDHVGEDVRASLGARTSAELRDDELLRTSQVARLFHVSPRTVNNWVAQGRLRAIATAGGHKRYRLDDVLALYREQSGPAEGTSSR